MVHVVRNMNVTSEKIERFIKKRMEFAQCLKKSVNST